MKRHLGTALALFYLSGLWVYQLPVSSFERVLMKVLAPVQNVSFANRQYRMYAPGPRSRKRLAFVTLKTTLSPVTFYKGPSRPITAERWSNFISHLAKSLNGEWSDYPPEEGRAVFRRFAQDVCRRESDALERVKTVSLHARLVDFSDFRGDIVWNPPQELERYECF